MKLIVILCLVSTMASAENVENVWFKFGPDKQPRYVLKGKTLPLCGVFESVTAEQIENKSTKEKVPLVIDSCLQAHDSIDPDPRPVFTVLDLNMGKLKIQIPDHPGLIYWVKANDLASIWALRFLEGDILLENTEICEKMPSFRQFEKPVKSEKKTKSPRVLPFESASDGDLIRYHVFEYHLGCGT